MSTLPFLLSVADELDNINSQSYMDDFGLGFHPHRQYYRSPTIQLSLPASTEWMEHERQQRYHRPHKFVFETQNNLSAASEGDEDDGADEAGNGGHGSGSGGGSGGGGGGGGASNMTDASADNAYTERYGSGSASTSAASRQKYTSLLNSNSGNGLDEGGESIDNSVQMYNLSKKCCKNYYRRTDDASGGVTTGGKEKSSSEGGYRLHAKCMEGNHSSSDESLQKATSSIEFLTCFLVKKSRAPKSGVSGSSGKKS